MYMYTTTTFLTVGIIYGYGICDVCQAWCLCVLICLMLLPFTWNRGLRPWSFCTSWLSYRSAENSLLMLSVSTLSVYVGLIVICILQQNISLNIAFYGLHRLFSSQIFFLFWKGNCIDWVDLFSSVLNL